MRICYISRPGMGVITGRGNAGGGQLHSLREAIELSKDKRFDVHMLIEGEKREQFRHKNITVTAMKKRGLIGDLWETYTAIKKINADIFISRMPTRLQIFTEAMFCRMLGKNYVYAEIINPYFILRRPMTLIGKCLYRAGLKLAAEVIANGKTIKEKLSKFTKRKIMVINVPMNLDGKKGMKRKYIIWVGRADHLKRPDLFVKLAQQLPEEQFLMILSGKFEPPKEKNITVLKDIPYEKMNDYYASSKLIVQTSETEGFPNVFLEAWKNRTPVVSLFVNPDNVLTEHKTGLYSGTFEQLVKDVKLLLNNPEKWKECSENGHEYVIKEHDISKIMEEYKKLFLKLADKNRESL